MPPAVRHTSCNLCDAMCGLRVQVDGDEVLSVRGDPDDPHSRGHICSKAHALKELYEDPDRLRTPLLRSADGHLQPATWESALDASATNLRKVQRQHGPDAVALYIGNPTAHSHRAALGAQLLTSALASRNRYDANSQDSNPRLFGCMLAYGDALAMPVPDVDRTRHLLLLGANPAMSQGSQMGLGDARKRLQAIQQRGGQLVVMDPRRTETAAWADRHLFIRPGGDAALLLAMLHVADRNGWVDQRFVATRTSGSARLFASAAQFAPDRVGDRIGVPAADIVQVARQFCAAGPAALHIRVGVCQNEFGPLANYLGEVWNAVTGNLGRVGGMLFPDPPADVAPLGRLTIGTAWGRWRSRLRGLPELLGALPSGALAEEMATPGKGQIRALVTLAGNPVLSLPGGARLAELLRKLDWFTAIDIYAGATARLADAVLPPRHVFQSQRFDLLLNRFGVRHAVRHDRPILPAPSDSLDDWQIAVELALRLRLPRWLHRPVRRLMADAPERIVDGLLRTGAWNLTLDEVAAAPHGLDLGPLRPGVDGRVFHADGRVDLAADDALADLPRLQTWLDTPPPALQLIGRRNLRDCNSWLHNLPSTAKGPSRADLLVHPNDAAVAGMTGDDTAQVRSDFGMVVAQVRRSDSVMPGVVCLPHGFGHSDAAATLRIAGASAAPNVNALTDPSLVEPLIGQSVLNGVAVRLEASRGG